MLLSALHTFIRSIVVLSACTVVLLGISSGIYAQTTLSVDSTMKEIEQLYNNGQYVACELEARRFAEESSINDTVKVQIEQWIAFSLIAQGKTALARDRFLLLLAINPDYELDQMLTSPKILSVFNDAKVKMLANKKTRIDSTNVVPIQRLPETITYRTIAFPGWEQLHQGRVTRGYIFMGAGAVSLGSGIVFEILRADARDRYLAAKSISDINSTYDDYNRYRKSELFSFSAFAAVYLLSELDVFTEFSDIFAPATSINTNNNNHLLRFSIRF